MCRAASVVLGQPRALVPDDIPRLSALPLHERSGISPSDVAKGQSKLDLVCGMEGFMNVILAMVISRQFFLRSNITRVFLTDGCLLLQISGHLPSRTAPACLIQRSPRSRSRQVSRNVKGLALSAIAPGGVASAKAATARMTVGGA